MFFEILDISLKNFTILASVVPSINQLSQELMSREIGVFSETMLLN